MYYVYVLECKGGSLYTGFTNDIHRRMIAHTSGKGAKYTLSHPPVALRALWKCESESGARKLEYAIKNNLTKEEKEKLIGNPVYLTMMFPKLEEFNYTFLANITLERCLEENL